MGRQILPPLLPTIMADLSITAFQAGIALTVLWATYALAHYPAGRFADRLSRKTVIVGGLVVLVLGFSLLSITFNYPLFVTAAITVGIGAGLFFISMRALAADLFTSNRGLAFGVQASFGNVGSSAAAGIALVILSIATWRSAFLPLAVFFLLLVVLMHYWSREPYVLEPVDVGVVDTTLRVFGDRDIRRIVAAYVLFVFSWQGIVGFLPTFLQTEKGFSTEVASGGFAIIFLIGIVVGPLAGSLGDRYDKLPVAVVAMLSMTAGLGLLVLVHSFAATALAIVVLSVGFWAFTPVIQAYLMNVFTDDSMASDLGAVKTVYSGIGSLGPSYVGLVAGWRSYTVAYTGLVGCLLLSVGMVTYIWWAGK